MEHNTKPKRTRVLRASDVIPPFDENLAPADAGGADPVQPEPPRSEPDGDDHPVQGDPETPVADLGQTDPDGGSSVTGSPDIPKYDLAENILAEQRRVAAKRRRSPGQGQEDAPPVSSEQGDARAVACELPSEDLPELQRIVAQIVAKDIERLCRRPDRAS